MIDYTTIQTFDVLPDLKALNNANLSLGKENKLLRNIINGVLICGGLYIGYRIIIYIKENRVKLSKGEKIINF